MKAMIMMLISKFEMPTIRATINDESVGNNTKEEDEEDDVGLW
jgi:hypothetical protein